MTVFEIREALGLVPLHEAEDRPVTGGYAGDLLSWVMGRAQSGDCWITIRFGSRDLCLPKQVKYMMHPWY